MSTPSSTHPATHFVSLRRRLICMLYEAVLLFGVFFCADFLFDLFFANATQESALRHWRQLYLFLVIGTYFTYFWRHSGQTLPMQTWRIKIVSTTNQQTPTFKQACLRYSCAWMWCLPALGINYLFEIKEWPSVLVIFIGVAVWALASKLNKNGQFLHDRLAGTQLVLVPQHTFPR